VNPRRCYFKLRTVLESSGPASLISRNSLKSDDLTENNQLMSLGDCGYLVSSQRITAYVVSSQRARTLTPRRSIFR